jgi:dephospho-CoA kinase
MKIALTGNYYSGQYEVSFLLRDKNVPVFDADVVLKYILNFSPKHMNKISTVFGEDYYNYGLLRLNLFKKTKDWDKLLDVVEYDLLQCYEKFRLKNKNRKSMNKDQLKQLVNAYNQLVLKISILI